jgi:hypothetical protein
MQLQASVGLTPDRAARSANLPPTYSSRDPSGEGNFVQKELLLMMAPLHAKAAIAPPIDPWSLESLGGDASRARWFPFLRRNNSPIG